MRARKVQIVLLAALALLAVPVTALALGPRAGRRHGKGHRGRAGSSSGPAAIPTARAAGGVAQVGALYPNADTAKHNCTASVVDSRRGDLLITAAHCVAGNGKGMVFAPGELGAGSPYGRWTVTGAYLARAWVSRQDPDHDVAFLTVAPEMLDGELTEIQQVTGAYRLGPTARRGELVTVTGYPAATAGDPISCRARVRVADGFPAFDCHGYVGGTSGSPWVLHTRRGALLVGIIGGRHQGGCMEDVSYSPPIAGSRTTYRRALAMTAADRAPALRSDGC